MQFLDSPAPFSPINPHGAKAKARVPDGWKNPMIGPLYRVCVEERGQRQPIYITPAMDKDMAEMLCLAAKAGIANGARADWANPSVVLCKL